MSADTSRLVSGGLYSPGFQQQFTRMPLEAMTWRHHGGNAGNLRLRQGEQDPAGRCEARLCPAVTCDPGLTLLLPGAWPAPTCCFPFLQFPAWLPFITGVEVCAGFVFCYANFKCTNRTGQKKEPGLLSQLGSCQPSVSQSCFIFLFSFFGGVGRGLEY